MTISTRVTPAGGDSPQDNQPQPNPGPLPNPGQPQNVVQQPAAPQPTAAEPDSPQPSQHDESGASEYLSPGEPVASTDEGEPEFPTAELLKLDEMINRPRWVVPVLPQGELEVLLEATIGLCKKGLDTKSEPCQRFFREGLTTSFTKILTDEAVSSWKYDIHKCILSNAERLVELIVVKMSQDWFPLLDLLSVVFNPNCKFHCYNGARPSETVPAGTQVSEDELYAKPPDPRTPRGWLVDLVNRFGQLGGFQMLLDRFTDGPTLSVPVIAALVRPFGLCSEVLTTSCIQKYFMPLVDMVPKFLDELTDEELKKESKIEGKNDALSGVIKALKCLASRIQGQEETVKNLEIFRLKMILRLLQISSFNGKMNALNEINKMIANVSYLSHRHGQMEDDEWLNAEKMGEWIQKNEVLSIVLRDALHQPQYVEKLEKILRFMIKEKNLTLQDLDKIWEAQAGKHEAIVKNVHDLLTKLAWDFSPEQLDHLFRRFQESWTKATKKQREKLLELIRRLAEDDKEGVMANKVLGLLWNLAHSEDVPTEIMDQALNAHLRILDYSCSQDRDAQKIQWINKFMEELKHDKWVLPALKQIREICQLFGEAPQNFPHTQRTPHMYYRNQVISDLQNNHFIVMLVAKNLSNYMNKAKTYAEANPDVDATNIYPDGRFNHVVQVSERLKFLRFLLKDGQLWLCEPQAKQIWNCLAENAIYPPDREACFRWFTKLMGEEPDLDPEITRQFFENNILQLDPSLLTENGMNCYERFFKAVNIKENKITPKRRGGYMMEDLELIGLEYLWRVVIHSPDEVSEKATQLLKDIYTNVGPRLQQQQQQVDIHMDFLQDCMDRLKASYDTITVLQKDKDSVQHVQIEARRMVRVLTVVKEYVAECDDAYGEERVILPLGRACRGKHVTLLVRFPNQGRQAEDIDVWSHTNDTVGSVRRQILHRVKANNSNIKVDLYLNGEHLDPSEDKKLISQIPVRDKTLITAKLCQVGGNMPSSPDSSSDSSSGSPHAFDGPNVEAENYLPGVIMANRSGYAQFLFQMADLGSQLQMGRLVDCCRTLLRLMPADTQVVEQLKKICMENAKKGDQSIAPALENLYFGPSPSQVLYNLEVTYSLLMPGHNPLSEEAYEFQHNYMKSGGVSVALNMLTRNNFMPNADLNTRRSAYLYSLKISKLLTTAVAHANVQVVADAVQSEAQTSPVPVRVHNHAVILQQALHHMPNPNAEYMTRNVALRLGQHLSKQITGMMPDQNTVKAIQKIGWCTSCGCLDLVHASNDDIHAAHSCQREGLLDSDDVAVCREAMEVLTVCLALCTLALEQQNKDKAWQTFIIDLLLHSRSRSVRMGASEQFLLMATKCCAGNRPLLFFITLLFTVLDTVVKDNAKQSHEYFQLLHRLLNYAFGSQATLPTADRLLNNEISWLKKVKEDVILTGDVQVEEALLEGHLGVTRELLAFQPAEKKYHIGTEEGGANLITELVEEFIFPASKIMLEFRRKNVLPSDQAVPVCSTPLTITAAFDLLVQLCAGCVQNLQRLADMLMKMYYSDEHDTPLVDWEYLPPIGPRPHNGFVGLKNAGATCYMNSVLQQLFLIDPIRIGIMSAEGAGDDLEDDDSEEKAENEANLETESDRSEVEKASRQDERKSYDMGVLKHVQAIFGHTACSRLQYYIPKGFWKHFKLAGEPVNLREQHDALEFLNCLVDSLDEALKMLGQTPILSKVLGGSFADQKICKGCPHRYSREEPFTQLSCDIRHHQNLLDSLEQFVKGDLLEGTNAYHCEKCNKKVDTVKRMCVKRLPRLLAIQLKRFDYDWERECAIKFNDYFEFPRELDMEPYTVQGLAKIDGEAITEDGEEEGKDESSCTKYRLVGVVVHSGQASGGHYYSYILHRVSEPHKWYKFDDGEVTECKMDDDEEMKNQCFGGEYMGEVFDHMLKRMSYRRQKRWWNAYILVYERLDQGTLDKDISKSMQDLTITNKPQQLKMPVAIERSVRKQNIEFMHNRNQFSMEYFQFMRKLLMCNAHYITPVQGQDKLSPEAEEMAMLSTQLAAKFLFNVAFHTKKTLRGPASEWYDALSVHLRHSKKVRHWFAQNVLFAKPHRFAEYLLESPSSEVRNAFMKIIVFLAHFCLQDGPCPPGTVPTSQGMDSNATLSDHLLMAVLSLLNQEVAEHGRHLTQYFHLFLMYANLGIAEKQQLLKLNVPALFMLVALDEGPGPAIKYQHAELGKLYSVVSQLIRCCDVSSRCQSSVTGQAPVANAHVDPSLGKPLMSIQSQVADVLYSRPSYVKKVIEDCNSSEETVKLLRFCSWENPHFSSTVLNELLWQIAFSYTYELRPHLDLLLQMLLLDDSWQNHRIHNALKGIPDDRDGLFDTIQRSKSHQQKRAYQCIKMMVSLFRLCVPARQMLESNGDMKRKWSWAVEWLNDELERRPYGGNSQYAYNSWSPPAQSNETSNGYFLERSQSAKWTLRMAYELLPEDEPEEQEEEEGSAQPAEGQSQAYSPQQHQRYPPQQNNQGSGNPPSYSQVGPQQGQKSPGQARQSSPSRPIPVRSGPSTPPEGNIDPQTSPQKPVQPDSGEEEKIKKKQTLEDKEKPGHEDKGEGQDESKVVTQEA